MNIAESPYGLKKRICLINHPIREFKPKSVLDLGCGTGRNVTQFIAELNPNISFIGYDFDKVSIEYAKKHNHFKNLQYFDDSNFDQSLKFDMIIVSEVIEHVEVLDKFMLNIYEKLNKNGFVIIATPNGNGLYEISEFFFVFLSLSKLVKRLSNFVSRLFFKPQLATKNHPDLTNSGSFGVQSLTKGCPHVNFFNYAQISSFLEKNGFKIIQWRSTYFIANDSFYFFNRYVIRGKLLRWNTIIPDYIPYKLSSDWCILLQKDDNFNKITTPYKKGVFENFRMIQHKILWG